MVEKLKNRKEWLKMRQKGIGGSDAGTVLGLNPYKSNLQLWEEKTGLKTPDDISGKPSVSYGKKAEPFIREMFKLDFPEYDVDYHEFYMYFNDAISFIFATLDGELTEKETGRKGILEIKTTTIQNSVQWKEWDGRIPDIYYAQILHQLAATGWDFAILKVHIRYYKNGELSAVERHYRIDKKDVEEEIDFLIKQEMNFWQKVQSKTPPPIILSFR